MSTPAQAGGLTTLPHTGQSLNHWPGLLMDMGNVNHADPHLNHESWAAGESFRHSLPYDVEGTGATIPSTITARTYERAFYDGGVLIEKTRARATTRSYIFKSDADRELAKQDALNELPVRQNLHGRERRHGGRVGVRRGIDLEEDDGGVLRHAGVALSAPAFAATAIFMRRAVLQHEARNPEDLLGGLSGDVLHGIDDGVELLWRPGSRAV